ncbi:MAG TPA: hypothetical protein VNM87_01595, partial [Candidatus Udaeobacter sp.]|nr:hypothetical protein [Candidatus Udaeobacter sp.]
MAESRAARLRATPFRVYVTPALTSFVRALLRRLATPALVLVTIAGAAYLLARAVESGYPALGLLPEWTLGVWVVLFLATELTPVGLPRGGFMTVSSAFDYAAIVLFGPFVTAILDLISGMAAHGLARPRPPVRVFFNLATCVISAFGASAVFEALGGTRGAIALDPRGLLAFAGLGVTYFILNTGLVSLVLAIE